VCKDVLHLPYPELLPSTRFEIRRALTRFTSSYSGSVQALFDSAAASRDAPGYAGARSPEAVDPRDADFVEHDRYFQVVRVTDLPAETFLRGLVLAHSWVYDNGTKMGVTTLDGDEWRQLFMGLDAILRYATGQPAGMADPVGVPAASRCLPDGYDPKRRWLAGHQLFFAIMQGAIVSLSCFSRAAGGGDDRGASAAMGVASAFMRSSAIAFKFCADFDPVDYARQIRPAMGPPAVQTGFSGLQTRDHAFLAGLFGQLRSAGCPSRSRLVGDAFQEFVDATVTAYEAHKYVCARFGGDVLPSLRMAAASGGRTTQSGVAALRLIMRRRLFSLTGDDSWNGGGTA
jgi:hypothetical protein